MNWPQVMLGAVLVLAVIYLAPKGCGCQRRKAKAEALFGRL